MKCFVDLAPPPDVLVGCRGDRDCPDYTACENRKCINPCAERDPCARNANCRVIAHQPVCTCPDGYIGDPQTSCSLRKYQKHSSTKNDDAIRLGKYLVRNILYKGTLQSYERETSWSHQNFIVFHFLILKKLPVKIGAFFA